MKLYKKFQMAKKDRGFGLVELLVAIAVFAVVMTLSMSAIVGVFDANKKSQTLRSVMDNMNFALESMTRTIRFGSDYHCDAAILPASTPRDCGGVGASSMAVKDQAGLTTVYKLSGTRVARSVNGGPDYFITSPDIIITNLAFRVFGSPPYNNGTDLYQPQAIIVLSGYVGTKPTTQSTFSLQTTVSQRTFDF